MSTSYHETGLSEQAMNLHRALASLIEELEAVDWYNQRADVTAEPDLKAILEHNRDEEIEHAAMALEWIRRQLPQFDNELKTYLFTSGPVTQIEEGAAGEEEQGGQSPQTSGPGDLGIGRITKGA